MRRRASLRLPGYDYSTPGAYFVTVCTRGRDLLGRITVGEVELTDIGRTVESCWLRLPRHLPSVELDAFVIMPDHVHGIVMLAPGARQASPLHVVVAGFKACSSRLVGRRLWQRGYYEHVIRNDDDLRAVRQYIADNPRKIP